MTVITSFSTIDLEHLNTLRASALNTKVATRSACFACGELTGARSKNLILAMGRLIQRENSPTRFGAIENVKWGGWGAQKLMNAKMNVFNAMLARECKYDNITTEDINRLLGNSLSNCTSVVQIHALAKDILRKISERNANSLENTDNNVKLSKDELSKKFIEYQKRPPSTKAMYYRGEADLRGNIDIYWTVNSCRQYHIIPELSSSLTLKNGDKINTVTKVQNKIEEFLRKYDFMDLSEQGMTVKELFAFLSEKNEELFGSSSNGNDFLHLRAGRNEDSSINVMVVRENKTLFEANVSQKGEVSIINCDDGTTEAAKPNTEPVAAGPKTAVQVDVKQTEVKPEVTEEIEAAGPKTAEKPVTEGTQKTTVSSHEAQADAINQQDAQKNAVPQADVTQTGAVAPEDVQTTTAAPQEPQQ